LAVLNCFLALNVSNLQHPITAVIPFMFRKTVFIATANKIYEHAHSAERITVVGLLLTLSSL
jgi:hypothetical protein